MRVLLGFLFLLLASVAPAQEARLQLEDGTVLQGVLVDVEEQHVQLRVDGRVITVPIAKIVGFTEVEPGSPPPVSDNLLPVSPGTPDAPRPQGTISSPGSTSDDGPTSLFEARLGWMAERYTWIPTDDTKTVASVAMVFMLLIAFGFHFATSVTSMEAASFQRALVLAIVVVAAAAAQIGFVPNTPTAALIAVGSSLVGWVVMSKIIYQARVMDMLWMALAMAVCTFVSMLILELINGVMGMLDESGPRFDT